MFSGMVSPSESVQPLAFSVRLFDYEFLLSADSHLLSAYTNKKDCPHCWDSLLMFSSEYYTASQARSKISMGMAMVFVTTWKANRVIMSDSLR
jgi:hypothetical protein